MRVLLDTCTFLWLDAASPELSTKARAVLDEGDVEVFVSIASIWEIGIKQSLGKLPFVAPVEEVVRRYSSQGSIQVIPIRVEHVSRIESLPFVHRDPFDRILAAQAIEEELTVLSPDSRFTQYGVRRIW